MNRVYEVEEHMGDRFMAGLAKLHIHHKKIAHMDSQLFNLLETKTKSMPAQVMGARIGKMCKSLLNVKSNL